MRLLTSWLHDFVDLQASAEEIAAKLGLRGFEVAAVEPADELPPAPWATPRGPDGIIDFEITANRPDCLSVLGLAREVATAFDRPLRLPSAAPGSPIALASTPVGESQRLRVTLEAPELCPRYTAAVADVTTASSPSWLTARLRAAGVRPISAVVDITNYVLLELGHPMHAFDLEAIAGAELRVRRAKPGEMLRTLDNVDRKLDPEMLVIADANRAQAVAGVMGGAASELSSATRSVAFESAWFKPTSVRRTSKRLGLKTEASARFERGADIGLPVIALERAIALMNLVGAGRVSGPIVDQYPVVRPTARLRLRRSRMAALLGVDVPDSDVARILRGLGLDPTPTGDGWEVVVPSFRVDLAREVDLIEEVGRHFGFDRLPPTFPVVARPAPAPDARIDRDRLARRVLTGAGLSEAITFGFIDAAAAEAFVPAGGASAVLAISNPLSAKFETLRPSLLPGLIDSVGHNRRHGARDVGLFEIGTRFRGDIGETRGIAVAWTGGAVPEHWSGGRREVDFFDVKGLVEQLCDALAVKVRFVPREQPFLAPGRAAAIVAADVDGAPLVGIAGQVEPTLAERRGLPRQDDVFVAELDLDELARMHVTRDAAVVPLPRFPFVVRDLSIVVEDSLPAEIIRGTILAAAARGAAPLGAVSFFDRYKGRNVSQGKVSISVHLTFQATDRTLTDGEVQDSFDRILAALVRDHGAVQR